MLQYRITTPEQVHFHYEVAGLTTRTMAWLLDQLILLVVMIALLIAASGGGEVGFAIFLLAKLVLDFGYFTFFELRWAGRTPGKRALGIRVISSTGGQLRFHDVFARTLMRVVDSPPVVVVSVPLVAPLVALLDRWHRRLGDLAGDTIVVRDVKATLPSGVLRQQSRVNTFMEEATLRNRILSRVTREERDLMLDLMHRRDSLEPGAREAVFAQAAGYFRNRYGLPEDLEYLSDEQTVLNLALVIQNQRFTG